MTHFRHITKIIKGNKASDGDGVQLTRIIGSNELTMLDPFLLMDAFGSFLMAYHLKHMKGRGWMAFNGIISLLLASLFIIGWPVSSLWIVGLYISISLFFDGWALLSLAWVQKKLTE